MARNTRRREIAIENCQRKVPLQLKRFDNFLRRCTKQIGLRRDAAFVRFVTDLEMARLNGKYRRKSKTTDVLSFPSEERKKPVSLRRWTKDLRGSFLGDIAISPAVARRNAQRFGRTSEQEICILILHGLLHLLGYDHETDRGEMERVEAKLRRRLRLA